MRRRPRHNTTRMAELFLPHEITGSAKRNPSCFLRPEIDLLWPRSGCRLLLEGSKQEGHRYRAMPRAYLSSLEQSYCVLFFLWGEREAPASGIRNLWRWVKSDAQKQQPGTSPAYLVGNDPSFLLGLLLNKRKDRERSWGGERET